MLKPSASSAGCTPPFSKYSRTTLEPGASDVFTHGLVLRPRATAFLARRPAASITLGLEVLVQLVIAASTTAPSLSWNDAPLSVQSTADSASVPVPPSATIEASGDPGSLPPVAAARTRVFSTERSLRYDTLAAVSGIRSCGRLGPAIDGTTVERSSSIVSENTGSGVSSVRKIPCALQYASTSATWCAERPDSVRYFSVSASTGKKPMVAPYSGDILAIVARSASESVLRPGP